MAADRLVAPLLFEVRACQLLVSCGAASLADIPTAWFADLRRLGFDFLYLLGVWTTGQAGLAHSIRLGVDPSVAVSSPFAVTSYHVCPELGGDAALRVFRQQANRVGLRVICDFVCNHVATDHDWTRSYPHLFVQGTDSEAMRHPERYFKAEEGGPWLAHGRDMHSAAGWRDTAQLNLRHPHTRALMRGILVYMASSGLMDGARCDMAMLALSSVMAKTWGDLPLSLPGPFPIPPLTADLPDMYPAAAPPSVGIFLRSDSSTSSSTIAPSAVAAAAAGKMPAAAPPVPPMSLTGISLATESPVPGQGAVRLDSNEKLAPVIDEEWWEDAIVGVRAVAPGFVCIAECYWDLEHILLSAGFDYSYDKTLYDRLHTGDAQAVLSHLRAPLSWQQRLVRFTENHDEQRACFLHRGGPRGAAAAAAVAYASAGAWAGMPAALCGVCCACALSCRARARM